MRTVAIGRGAATVAAYHLNIARYGGSRGSNRVVYIQKIFETQNLKITSEDSIGRQRPLLTLLTLRVLAFEGTASGGVIGRRSWRGVIVFMTAEIRHTTAWTDGSSLRPIPPLSDIRRSTDQRISELQHQDCYLWEYHSEADRGWLHLSF